MRKRIGGLLLALILASVPATAHAQAGDTAWNYEVPPVPFTGPFSHPRYETGGFYIGAEFLYYKQSVPLRGQLVAVRGFMDIDGSITGTPRTFVGSGAEALNTNQVTGVNNFTPGTNVFIGWRFEDGVTVELDWLHLLNVRYSASASTIPPDFNVGGQLANTFLFSGVSNFPPEFAGAARNLPIGNPGATYGIWNAAETMQIQFNQRFDMGQIKARIPIWQTENYRSYSYFGPRLVTQWENFSWRTISSDPLGQTNAGFIGTYYNTVSNRMYGAILGCGNDWYLGTTPIGAFSAIADFDAGLYLDLVKGRAGYGLETRTISIHRARNMSTLVPGIDARFGLKWYPWEAISLQVGYDFMAFFNTVASRYPIDFNMGTIDPKFETGVLRYFHGVNFGLSFVF